MADNNFLSSLLNYGQSLAQHYLPDSQAPGQGVLGNIYSTIDSTKRKISDFVQNPVESTRQFISNQNEDAGKQLGLLHQSFTGADGRPTIGPQTPQAQAAHNELTDGMTAAMMGATVWHGSPHKFDAFDSAKIGTGEGAQAYGHGLYLADNPAVAKGYADNVKDMSAVQKINSELSQVADIMGKDAIPGSWRKYRTDAGAKAAQRYDELMSARSGVSNAPGTMYKVDLPDEHIAKMLDWDKPLSQQSEAVQKAADSLAGDRMSQALEFQKNYGITNKYDTLTGEEFLRGLGKGGTAESALQKAGIPGIRYLDGGSRATGGTSNYVVFPGNEHLLSIQERNGVPLSSLLKK